MVLLLWMFNILREWHWNVHGQFRRKILFRGRISRRLSQYLNRSPRSASVVWGKIWCAGYRCKSSLHGKHSINESVLVLSNILYILQDSSFESCVCNEDLCNSYNTSCYSCHGYDVCEVSYSCRRLILQGNFGVEGPLNFLVVTSNIHGLYIFQPDSLELCDGLCATVDYYAIGNTTHAKTTFLE